MKRVFGRLLCFVGFHRENMGFDYEPGFVTAVVVCLRCGAVIAVSRTPTGLA